MCAIRSVLVGVTLELIENRVVKNSSRLHTFGDGMTLKVFMILSGYSSLIFEINSVPIPEPVPPPSECVNWKPWRQSHVSASFLTTSSTESTNSAPSV